MRQDKNYLLVGPPNVGKSTYYNKITWKVSPVGNIDRLTTTSYKAKLRNNKNINVIDLPGIVSLTPYNDDEFETLRWILNQNYDGVVNIISASSLKRDLLLTCDLAQAGILKCININMIDEVDEKSFNIHPIVSSFNVPVNLISAKKNINIKQSLIFLNTGLTSKREINLLYSKKIETVISEIIRIIPNSKLNKRFIAIQVILKNKLIHKWLDENNCLVQILEIIKKHNVNDSDLFEIVKSKQDFCDHLISKIFKINHINFERTKLENYKNNKFNLALDKIFLNKWSSIPIFLLLIAFIWFITFYEYAGGWIQAKFADDALGGLQSLLNDSIRNLNPDSISQNWWSEFVSNGILGGIFTIISFIPWLLILIFFSTLLEQVGILSRMSIVFDGIFKKSGISGRSILNIVMGVGCNIPSIIMARNSNSIKEKVVVSLIMPFVSCSARVLVYGFITQALVSAQWTWSVNLLITIIIVLVCLFFGYFFSNILFRKNNNLFITELPRYRSPDFFVIFKKMILETYDFVKRVIIIVGIMNLLMWVLTYTGPSSVILDVDDPAQIKQSFLRYITIPFQILLYPTGIGEHWQLTISIVTAFPAKEIAASNIEILFDNGNGGINGFHDFLANINLYHATLISYLTFFAFYIPCLATISVLFKEVGKKYTTIHILTSLIGSIIMSIIVFSVVGSIESLIIEKSQPIAILLCLIGVVIIIYAMLFNYKQYKWKKESIWSLKQFKSYHLCFYTNTLLFTGLIIGLDTLLLLNN